MFSYNEKMGIAIFCAGFLAGFGAMIEVRPLAIVTTSALGAIIFMGLWGLLSHLIEPQAAFVRKSFQWFVANPLMLIIACAVLAFVGVNYQFSTGPRGSLEG